MSRVRSSLSTRRMGGRSGPSAICARRVTKATRTCTSRSTVDYRWPIPGGGFYYIFIAGVPAFRKYDAEGNLLYERHIEGLEIDEHLRRLPTTWPRRKTRAGEFPVVPSAIRTAAVGPSGSLWIALASTAYLRLRQRRRQAPDHPVPRRRHHDAERSVLYENRPPDRRSRLLYVCGKLIVLVTRSLGSVT